MLPWDVYEKPSALPWNQAVAARLKQARKVLKLELDAFYDPARISRETAIAYERGNIPEQAA
jgi:hypothetical protein